MSSIISTHTAGNPYLHRVYHASNDDELEAIYADWAATFDSDMNPNSLGYVAPTMVAEALARNIDEHHLTFLDAGCGTGLSGLAVVARLGPNKGPSQTGPIEIDGVDLSSSMLEIAAKTKIYRSLKKANMNEPLPSADSSYDAIVCVGALTHGHIKAKAISEFVRIIRTDGVIAATVLEDIWESGGYRAEVDRLVEDDVIEVVESKVESYRRTGGVTARVLVLRKNGTASDDASSETS